MKSILLFAIFILTGFQLRALDISILITQYYAEKTPYIEVYLHTVASTVTPITSAGTITENQERKVKVVLLFKQNNETVRFDNFIIESGKQNLIKDFVALKRYGLKTGKYLMVFNCEDIADPTNTYKDSVEVNITDEVKKPFLSHLQLVADTVRSDDASLSKNGYFYELVPFGYVKSGLNRIGVYFESYHTDQLPGQNVMYTYKISKREKSGKYNVVSKTSIKRNNVPADHITTWFDATYYESGNYWLQLYLTDDSKNIIDSVQYFFTKSNPVRDESILAKRLIDEVETSFAGKLTNDELNYALRAIAMNVVPGDVELLNRIIKDENPISKTNYLFRHFKEKSPFHPAEYYTQYMEVAKAVDKKYKSGLGFGFETDRGLIFMKYGKPSDMINIQDDPSSAPYEVWVYYDIPRLQQSNVKFLFYNPFLDGMDYRLLQSNARGEVRNPAWRKELYKVVKGDNPQGLAPENWDVKDGFNRQASDWLEDL